MSPDNCQVIHVHPLKAILVAFLPKTTTNIKCRLLKVVTNDKKEGITENEIIHIVRKVFNQEPPADIGNIGTYGLQNNQGKNNIYIHTFLLTFNINYIIS